MSAYSIVQQPMEVQLNNLVFIANELFLLFSSYFILTFSLYVPALEIRYDFGFVYLVMFGVTTAWNIVLLILLVIRDICEVLRKKKVQKQNLRKQHLKAMSTPEGIKIRQLKSDEIAQERVKRVGQLVSHQLTSTDKQGNWHKVMPNGDIVHLSQVAEYDMLQI